jgi:RimJ/RimL family protein N-acetyltransferase
MAMVRLGLELCTHPELVGGVNRDLTLLMEALPGVVVNDGAAGVLAVVMPNGVALLIQPCIWPAPQFSEDLCTWVSFEPPYSYRTLSSRRKALLDLRVERKKLRPDEQRARTIGPELHCNRGWAADANEPYEHDRQSEFPVLVTDRLMLEPIADSHVPLVMELDSDPAVKRFIDGGKPPSITEIEAFVASSVGHRWMAFAKDDSTFIGWFGLVPGPDDQRELGYRIRSVYWNLGFATEGSIALRDLAFDTLDVRRLWAQTMTVNTGSRRVLEKVGLRFVRQFFVEWPDVIEGSEQGDVEYELWNPRVLHKGS